jgi:hypothetical protein
MRYSNLEKTFISRHILHQHWYTCPIALPVRRNPQHRSLLTCLSHFRTLVSTSSSSAELWPPTCEQLYVTDTFDRKQETFLYEFPLHWVLLPTKRHNRTLLFGTTVHKHGRHFDYWNQPLNMRTRVCYLHCHEAGLCCYLVIHIENLLRPLLLFYFHLCPVYWLPRIRRTKSSNSHKRWPTCTSSSNPGK